MIGKAEDTLPFSAGDPQGDKNELLTVLTLLGVRLRCGTIGDTGVTLKEFDCTRLFILWF